MATRERHLADLADELRLRLIERRRIAAAGGDSAAVDLADEVRALVDEAAALLDPATRAAVSTRIVRDTVGLGTFFKGAPRMMSRAGASHGAPPAASRPPRPVASVKPERAGRFLPPHSAGARPSS